MCEQRLPVRFTAQRRRVRRRVCACGGAADAAGQGHGEEAHRTGHDGGCTQVGQRWLDHGHEVGNAVVNQQHGRSRLAGVLAR